MTAPLSGPFVTEVGKNLSGPSSKYVYKRGFRQTKPYNLPLPYAMEISSILSISGTAVPGYDAYCNAGITATSYNCHVNSRTVFSGGEATTALARAKSMCFEKIVDQLDDKVELLVSLAERREAIDMVEKRLAQLYRFVKALKHRDPTLMRQFFHSAQLKQNARETLTKYLKNWRLVAKDLGNAWLEFHFGWEPIVKDIDTCLQLAGRPLSGASIHVYSRKLVFDASNSVLASDYSWKMKSNVVGKVRASCTCTATVDSPKRVYQSILGLNNPVLVVYSLIPYSWMFDWANYLGSYISQFSDLAGYNITNACNSYKITCLGNSEFEYPRGVINKGNVFSGVCFVRENGIPSVTLGWRPLPKQLSVSRGLTLTALLAKKLAK